MKRYFLSTLIILFLGVLFSFSTGGKKIIVIDAGHGGVDHGAVVDNHQEKDITLAIAQQIQKLNTDKNLEIVLTRNEGGMTLSDRVALVQKLNPALVISLHVNFHPKDKLKQGVEIYTQKNLASKDLAAALAEKFTNPVVKEQNLYLLRNLESPALVLETGFLSNDNDRARLVSEEGQKQIAEKILDFLYEVK